MVMTERMVGPAGQAKARELRGRGWTKRQIADELGVAPSTVAGWMPGEKDSHRPPTVSQARLEELRDQGLTYAEIGRRVGLTRASISLRLGASQHRNLGENSLRFTATVAPGTAEVLGRMALDLGMRKMAGVKAGEGNVGELLDAIARGEFKLTPA